LQYAHVLYGIVKDVATFGINIMPSGVGIGIGIL